MFPQLEHILDYRSNLPISIIFFPLAIALVFSIEKKECHPASTMPFARRDYISCRLHSGPPLLCIILPCQYIGYFIVEIISLIRYVFVELISKERSFTAFLKLQTFYKILQYQRQCHPVMQCLCQLYSHSL